MASFKPTQPHSEREQTIVKGLVFLLIELYSYQVGLVQGLAANSC